MRQAELLPEPGRGRVALDEHNQRAAEASETGRAAAAAAAVVVVVVVVVVAEEEQGHGRGQRPPKASGTNMTVEAT